MISIVYHKKAFVLKIPLRPPFPKGNNKDNGQILMRLLPTHFHDEPYFFRARQDILSLPVAFDQENEVNAVFFMLRNKYFRSFL